MGCWWHPGVVVEEPDESVEGADVVFAGGGEVAADMSEAFGAGVAFEAGGHLPVEFHGPEVTLCLVVGHGPVEVVHVAEDRPLVGLEGDPQVVRLALGRAAGTLAGLGVEGERFGDQAVVAGIEAPSQGRG